MSFIQSASSLTSALVHPLMQRSSFDRAASETFLREKLAFTAATLVATPFLLAYHGVPTLAEAVLFALALGQIGAAMLVVRTGRLAIGHILATCSFAGIALVLAFSIVGGVAASIPWIVLAALEGASSGDRRTFTFGSIVAASLLAAVLIAGVPAERATGGLILTAAIAVLATLAIGSRIHTLLSGLRTIADRNRGRSDALFAALGDPVIHFDLDGQVRRVTADMEELLGHAPVVLSGRGLFDRVHVADRPAYLKLIADAVHVKGPHVGEIRLRSTIPHMHGAAFAEPTYVRVDMRTCRFDSPRQWRGGDGEIIAVLRVLAEPSRPAVEIRPDATADDPATSRTEFLANMSHELRTPLNAIIGFSDMLASQTLRPTEESKQRDYARIINQSGQHLLSVVDSILDMSKIRSGTLTLQSEPFDVAPLIEQCCDMIRLDAQAARLQVAVDLPARLPKLIGDRRACKQILINLLSNAVKFTPENGSVTIELRADRETLDVVVTDNGIGIAEADLLKLGDPFFQASSAISRPHKGTGLGLSVVRGLVQLHGGTLVIASELGEGTSVTVRLPLDYRDVARGSSEGKPDISRISSIRRTPKAGLKQFPEPRMKQIA